MNKKKIYYWLLLPVLALMMGACSESNKNEEPAKPDTPVTPVDPGDWQTVPAAGGTITKGDIALTFPAGTFSSDTKVAITELKKGEVLGNEEVSPFCQVTMHVNSKNNVTVKIKCDQPEDDIQVVVSTPSIGKHAPDDITYIPVSYECTYSNGEYTAILEKSQNESSSENISFSVGLGHRAIFSSSRNINSSRATRAIEGEKEGKITWYFDTSRKFETDNAAALSTSIDNINTYMHEALKKIKALGFTLTISERKIPITVFAKNNNTKDLWGKFNQHWSNDTKSWFSIREDMLTDPKASQDDIKATIYHELLHYFQADYDQRIPFQKYRDCKSDDLLMYEAGGQWIEKFVYGFLPDRDSRMSSFLKGLIDIEAIYPQTDIGTARQSHGYAMSSLYEYWARVLGDDKIVDIYNEWATHIDGWGFKNDLTINILKRFASKHDSYIFYGGYNSFIHDCVTGEISPQFDLDNTDFESKSIKLDKKSIVFEGTSYAYGADTKRLVITLKSNESFKDYEIVIKPQTDDIDTYIYRCYFQKKVKEGRFKLTRETSFTSADSLVISGEELEAVRNGEEINMIYYLVTSHYIDTEKTKKYKVNVELRKPTLPSPTVSPTELTFEAEGGTQEAKITAPGFSYFGVSVDKAYSSWLSATPAKGGKVAVTAMANTTSEERMGYVKCYVANKADAPESEWVWLTPIKVTQKAGDASQQQQITEVEISSFKFKTGLYANCTQNHYNENGKLDKTEEYVSGSSFEGGYMDQSFTAENITSSFSGSTLHVKAEYEYRGQKYDVSFDVTGITGDYKEARVTSLTCKRVISESVFGHEKYNFTATYSNIPVNKIGKKSASDPLSLSRMTFEGTPANGMGISGYSCEKYTYDGWGGYTHYHFDYLDNAANFATLVIEFKSVK